MDKEILDELKAIKKLLLVLLLKLGANSDEIGAGLNMHAGSVRKIVPSSKIKKIEIIK